MLGELLNGGLKALADRPLFSFGDRANVIPLPLDGMQAVRACVQWSLIAAVACFEVCAQVPFLLQVVAVHHRRPVAHSAGGRILHHRRRGTPSTTPVPDGAAPERSDAIPPGRVWRFQSPFAGRGCPPEPEPAESALAALDFPFTFSLEVAIQSLHGLMKAPIQRFTAVRTVDRSQLVPLLLTAAVQPVRFTPVDLLPVGVDFKLLQMFADRLFLFQILLTFADLFFKVGLTGRAKPFAGLLNRFHSPWGAAPSW